MRYHNPLRRARPLLGRGPAVVAVAVAVAVLGGDLNLIAAGPGPGPRPWNPRRSVPPWGPYFAPPVVPREFPFSFSIPVPIPTPVPIPNPSPFSSVLPESGMNVPTDRCLVTPSPIDPRSVKTAASIDPGIFVAPRVQGLPVRPAVGRSRGR